MMQDLYYKVVREDMSSFSAAFLHEDAIVHYRHGQWAYPSLKGSKLLVFEDVEEARWFTWGGHLQNKDGSLRSAWLCHVVNPRPIKYIVKPMLIYSLHFMRRYWADEYFTSLSPAPDSTMACDAVKLVEPIQWSKL